MARVADVNVSAGADCAKAIQPNSALEKKTNGLIATSFTKRDPGKSSGNLRLFGRVSQASGVIWLGSFRRNSPKFTA